VFKMKQPPREGGISIGFRRRNKMEHLVDLTNSIITFALSIFTALFIWIANIMSLKDLQVYPGYLFEYFFRFSWPPIFYLGFATLYYFRHVDLRHFVLDYIKSFYD